MINLVFLKMNDIETIEKEEKELHEIYTDPRFYSLLVKQHSRLMTISNSDPEIKQLAHKLKEIILENDNLENKEKDQIISDIQKFMEIKSVELLNIKKSYNKGLELLDQVKKYKENILNNSEKKKKKKQQ